MLNSTSADEGGFICALPFAKQVWSRMLNRYTTECYGGSMIRAFLIAVMAVLIGGVTFTGSMKTPILRGDAAPSCAGNFD